MNVVTQNRLSNRYGFDRKTKRRGHTAAQNWDRLRNSNEREIYKDIYAHLDGNARKAVRIHDPQQPSGLDDNHLQTNGQQLEIRRESVKIVFDRGRGGVLQERGLLPRKDTD